MEETVLTQSTFTSLSVSLSYSPPRLSIYHRPPSHLPHTASKMLFSLHRHWILSRPVVFFPPWDCRSKSSRTNKIRARWPSRRPLFAMEYIQWLLSCVCVLIFQLYIYSKLVKNVPILHTTLTVAITRGLEKYLQFQYQRRRCIGFPPTWYAREKNREKGGKSHW